jgi:hypothetical protein
MAAFQFPSSPTVGQLYTASASQPTYVCRVSNPPNGNVWEKIGMGYSYSPVAFTATAGQTSFAVNYQVGAAEVFVEGGRLEEAEFTATNGTSIVMPYGMLGGERVIVIPSSVMSVLDTASFALNSAVLDRKLADQTMTVAASASPVVALDGCKNVEIMFDVIPNPAVADFLSYWQLSRDGGATWDSAASAYYYSISSGNGTARTEAAGASNDGLLAAYGIESTANFVYAKHKLSFTNGDETMYSRMHLDVSVFNSAGVYGTTIGMSQRQSPGAATHLRFISNIANAFAAGTRVTAKGC